MTANSLSPLAATTADRQATVSVTDQGLSLVTTCAVAASGAVAFAFIVRSLLQIGGAQLEARDKLWRYFRVGCLNAAARNAPDRDHKCRGHDGGHDVEDGLGRLRERELLDLGDRDRDDRLIDERH